MEHIIATLLREFEHGRMTRRQLIQSLALTATAASVTAARVSAADGKGFQAIGVNHISYSVPDLAKTRDFYADLLGMQVKGDTGEQCTLAFGNTSIIARRTQQADRAAYVDHFAITIDNWDKEAVEAELTRRGLQPTLDGRSFHVKDPDGFDLQISAGRSKPS
jgi:catechol 2,3-dioxygenase-like lactoylglutathione lyase family enzyme